FLDPGTDVNSGSFRPLTVITPPGTIVNANPPAPCGGMVEVKYCVETAVMGALAQALDGRVAGDHKGGGNHCYVGGRDPRAGATNRFWVRRNDQPIQPSALPGKISGFPIQPEDLLIMESSGGGGFGDALDRDLESVARDLAEGYVSPAAAEASYGVVSRAGV